MMAAQWMYQNELIDAIKAAKEVVLYNSAIDASMKIVKRDLIEVLKGQDRHYPIEAYTIEGVLYL